MPAFEVNIDRLDMGPIYALKHVAEGLEIETRSGLRAVAHFDPTTAALILMTVEACQYGGEGEDDEKTLAELREVFDRREARRIARMNEALSMGTAA